MSQWIVSLYYQGWPFGYLYLSIRKSYCKSSIIPTWHTEIRHSHFFQCLNYQSTHASKHYQYRALSLARESSANSLRQLILFPFHFLFFPWFISSVFIPTVHLFTSLTPTTTTMTSNNNNTETEIPIQKNQHRDDRLSFSNYAEHTLRKELNTIGTSVRMTYLICWYICTN